MVTRNKQTKTLIGNINARKLEEDRQRTARLHAKYGQYTFTDMITDTWKYGRWLLLGVGVIIITLAVLSIISYNAQVSSNVADFNLTATAIFK